MFAVSGWSVTAPLKTQIEEKRNVQSQSHIQRKDDDTKRSDPQNPKKSLKRKRSKGTQVENVTGDNVENLWQSVIEGKRPKRIRTKKNKSKVSKQDAGAADDEKSKQTASATGRDEQAQSNAEKKSKKKSKSNTGQSTSSTKSNASLPNTSSPAILTPLQASMRAKLSSARFRHLNEQLYTTPSSTAFSLFKETPDLFNEYHSGFRQQVEVWPENPVTGYINELRSRGTLRRFNANAVSKDSSSWNSTPLPRSKGVCTIADIGCGDARLSSTLQSKAQKLNLKILSFDLYSPSPLVTTADAANLPVIDGTVDIAIFCLALMGTNWLDFIDESWRILRPHGELWIAEIKSRFSRGREAAADKTSGRQAVISNSSRGSGYTKGGIGTLRADVPTLNKKDKERQQAEDEAELVAKVDVPDAIGRSTTAATLAASEKTDVSAFVTALRRRGFALAGNDKDAIDLSNKMFVKMRFTKAAQPVKGKNAVSDDLQAVDREGDRGGRKFGDRVPKKKMKFLENVGFMTDEDESRILKPCVYKLR